MLRQRCSFSSHECCLYCSILYKNEVSFQKSKINPIPELDLCTHKWRSGGNWIPTNCRSSCNFEIFVCFILQFTKASIFRINHFQKHPLSEASIINKINAHCVLIWNLTMKQMKVDTMKYDEYEILLRFMPWYNIIMGHLA